MSLKESLEKINNIFGISISFAKANFKLRNEGSYLGILWYLLEPILFLVILLTIRGVTSQGNIKYYPVYLFLGLIMYNFFMSVTSASTTAIQSKGKFVKNMTLQRESLVLSTPIQFIFSHIAELIVLTILMIYYHVGIVNLIYYPFIFLFLLIFTTGASFMLATLGVFINDIKNIWPVFMKILWFATPIFYAVNNKGLIGSLNYLNPLTHFMNIAREVIIYNQLPNLRGCILVVSVSIIFLFLGIKIFNKYKVRFAEEV
jgi:lipopolysaccharide transport system permease protein